MDFFESAHRPLKLSPKKPNSAAKNHIKQMLNAYKSGNNETLKTIAELQTSIRYDIDDVVSISEYSDVNNFKEANASTETISFNATFDALTSSNEQSINTIESLSERGYDEDSMISNDSVNDLARVDIVESITEYNEDLNSLTSSEDISTEKSIETNSSFINENVSENDSDVSITSSLGSSKVSELISDDEPFDPDGVLASKILEKLKLKEQIQLNQSYKSSTSNTRKLKQKVSKEHKKIGIDTKKKINHKKKRESILNKESISDVHEVNDNSIKENINIQDDDENSLDDSISNCSSPFVSITATTMVNQSLNDVIGDYRHPTVRNLPSEKKTTINDSSKVFDSEFMLVDLGEEVDSLIPELDEDLAIEGLSVGSDSQECVEDSTTYDDTNLTDVITDNELSYDKTTEDIKIKVYPGKKCFIFVMNHPAELYIHGKVKIACLGGSTELFGYTLRDEPVKVYAPYCYYAQCIKTFRYHNIFNGLFSKLTSAGLSVSNAEQIVTSIGIYDAVLCLSKLSCMRMDFVDNNCEGTDLFSKRVDTSVSYLKYAAETLGCSLYDRQQKRKFDEKKCWNQVVDCGKENQSRGIICGGKDTGKSTFLRYYVNRILDATNKPVLVIDLDPGQAEFTLPGCISASVIAKPLFGPNFTHLRDPEKTLNLGMINTMDNPKRYILAINELITYCKHAYQSMPWIVNTMGMCNQLGLKFITYIIVQVQPTFLYQINSKIPKKRYEFHLHSSIIKKLYKDFSRDSLFDPLHDPTKLEYTFLLEKFDEVSSEKFAGGTMTPREERYLNVLSYFGMLPDIHRTKGLLEIVPYMVSLANLNIALNVKIPEETVIEVINGKIIALCQLTSAPPVTGKVFTLRDKGLVCHGYGLIRGIDREHRLLYILTPTPISKLNYLVNILMYVDWMPELLNQEEILLNGSVVPYRACNSSMGHQHRQFMFAPRRRFNPLQLVKISRKT